MPRRGDKDESCGGRGARSGAGAQVQCQGHHRLLRELLLESRACCREIAFNIVDGDFKVFEDNGLAMRSMLLLTKAGKFRLARNFRLRFLMWWSWSLSSGFQSGYWKEGFAKRSKPTLFVSEKKQRGSKDYRAAR